MAGHLKKIYRSLTLEEADQELSAFARTWDPQYPTINQSWRRHWPHLVMLFEYPDDIRKVIEVPRTSRSSSVIAQSAPFLSPKIGPVTFPIVPEVINWPWPLHDAANYR